MSVLIPEMVYPVTVFVQLVRIAFDRAGRPSLRVSSWLRTEQRTRELAEAGLGKPTSLHPRGLAMDLQGAPDALQAMQTAWRALGLDAVSEAPALGVRVNPVLHIELDGPALRRLGVSFVA